MGTNYFPSDTGYTGATWSTLPLMPYISYPTPLPTLITDVNVDKVQDGPNDKLLLNGELAPPDAVDQIPTSGWLGAPLFGPGVQPTVIGVFSGVYFASGAKTPDSAWAGGVDMVQLVWYGINNWSSSSA
jgi:hypothetical protein